MQHLLLGLIQLLVHEELQIVVFCNVLTEVFEVTFLVSV
ncbi:hypothetical protein ACIVBQ_001633 [Tenacibaculum discolor]